MHAVGARHIPILRVVRPCDGLLGIMVAQPLHIVIERPAVPAHAAAAVAAPAPAAVAAAAPVVGLRSKTTVRLPSRSRSEGAEAIPARASGRAQRAAAHSRE